MTDLDSTAPYSDQDETLAYSDQDETLAYSDNDETQQYSDCDETKPYSDCDVTIEYRQKPNKTGLKLRIGTFNVRGLRTPDKKRQLADDADKYKTAIIGLQETHIKDAMTETIYSTSGKKYTLYTGQSATKNNHCYGGTGFLVDEELDATFTRDDDRICHLKLTTADRPYYIINAYAPTNSSSKKDSQPRDDFYNKLDCILRDIPNRAILFVLGDYNAQTGKGHDSHPHIIGPHGKGLKTTGNGDKPPTLHSHTT
jgi:hypothetical protein